MNILERALAPTPGFFKTLRNIGLLLTAISGAIIASPIALPAAVVSVAGYLAVGGSVLSAVSQITVEDSAMLPPGQAGGMPARDLGAQGLAGMPG